jgi:MOSC domain-containing protein YiiM
VTTGILIAMHVGTPRTLGEGTGSTGPDWTTSFIRDPHPGPLHLHRLGLSGDAPADTRHHGGPDKAVLLYTAAHYPRWRDEYPQLPIGPGGLGENWTVDGLSENTVCIGDVYRIGDAVVEVSQPRIPCWKISRRWAVEGLTERVRESGRTGWYVRVLQEGMVRAGDTLELTRRPYPDLTVARANDVIHGRLSDASLRAAFLACPALADGIRRAFER